MGNKTMTEQAEKVNHEKRSHSPLMLSKPAVKFAVVSLRTSQRPQTPSPFLHISAEKTLKTQQLNKSGCGTSTFGRKKKRIFLCFYLPSIMRTWKREESATIERPRWLGRGPKQAENVYRVNLRGREKKKKKKGSEGFRKCSESTRLFEARPQAISLGLACETEKKSGS